jgi:tetratricopeptide (TPR) repeat protein
MGELYEQHLGDSLRAVEVYREVLSEAPDFDATVEALEGMVERREEQTAAADVLMPIYRDAGQWQKLIDLYEVLVESQEGDIHGQAGLLKKIGEVCELRLEDPLAAFSAFGRALGLTPDDVELLDKLESLASELECWEALVGLLEERLGDLHDAEVALGVGLRIGRILEAELLDRSRAIDRFKTVVDLEPTNETAIKSLDRLYEQEGRWEELSLVLREEILQEEDDEGRKALRFRLGALYETALEDVDQAITTYHEILMGDPEHEGARESLERMFAGGYEPMSIGGILGPWYEERERWDKLVEVCMVQLEHREDSDERFDTLHRIASLYREKLEDHTSAFTVLGSAIGERPGDEETIEQLDAYAAELDGWSDLAGFYTEAFENTQNPEDQQRLLLKIAQIMDLKLSEVDAAEQAYNQVLEMNDSEQVALDALDRIYTQQSRWPELARIITRELELLMDEEKVVELSFRLATLLEHQLGDLDRAVETYNKLLDIQPTHAEALMALESIYRIREEWEPLFLIYERQSDLMEDDRGAQAEVFAKMAALAENMLMRPLDSIDLWNRVLTLREDDVTALQALSALYQREGQHGELVEVLEREVRVTGDDGRKVDLWQKIGEIWRDHLLNDDRALEAFREVLKLNPTNLHGLFACRNLYQRIGDYEALVGIIDQLIMEDTLGSDNLLELYIQLGEIQGSLLRNLEEAVKAWTAVLSIESTHKLALDSLEELYTELGRWEACVEVLGRKGEVLEASYEAKYGHLEEEEMTEEVLEDPLLDEQIELQLQIADIWENKISQREMAVLAYEAVLEIDPGHMQASRALEGLYTEEESWDKLVELYLVRQEYIEDEFEGLEILRNASRIYEEKLDNKDNAFLVLCRAFMENQEDEQTAVDLERLARETESWETLVNLYYNVLDESEESPDSVGLHIKVAKWWANELNDRTKAIEHYQKALELAPDNTEVMVDLEEIYEKASMWIEQVAIMELRADLISEDDQRTELYRKAGDVYDVQLSDTEKAVESYRMILRIDSTDVAALGALEGIYERGEAWPELIEVLERKSEIIYEPDDVVELKFRIAQLWEVQVGSIERAVDAYRVVLSIEQTDLASLESLERLYRHLEKWDELQEVFFMQLSMAQEPHEQISIYLRSARTYEVEMVDVDSAVEAYGNILLADPQNIEAIVELERLYTGMERWDDLYQVLERHVEAVQDPADQVELYHRIGAVCHTHLADIHRAIDAYRSVLGIDAANTDALYALAKLFELASDWEECLKAYEQLSGLVTDPEAGVEVHYRMGRIKEENLIDPEGAQERYLFSLEIDPSFKPSMDALQGMYERAEDWQGVITMLRQEEEYTRDLQNKAALLSRIGRIYEHSLGDEIRALDYYERTIELSPENLEAAAPLSRMYLREKRWARAWPLLDLLVQDAGHDHTQDDLFSLHYNLGLCCEELGQEDRALKEYGESYEHNPNHLPTLIGMARLLFKRGDHDRSYKIYRTITRHHADALDEGELSEIHGKCGEIKLRLGDTDAAIDLFEASLQSNPENMDALQAVLDLHTQAGNWEQVMGYRQRLLALMKDDLERYDSLLKMGDTMLQHLNNPGQAVELYRQALGLQPDSRLVLRKLLDLYTSAQMWTDAISILSRIADLEGDSSKKARFFYTVAVIYREEIGDTARAVEAFNKCLDHDPGVLKAFEAIDRILTGEHAWKELERSYRKMLNRVKDGPASPEGDALKLMLWKNLGEIFRTRQMNAKMAIETYKVASSMKPDDHKILEILADLYDRADGHAQDAIDTHKRLIAMQPFRIDSYRALFNTYMKTQLYDEAWCMSAALTFLNSAKDKEQEFYQNYLGQGPATPQRPLTADHWRLLYHPDQDQLINGILGLLATWMRKHYAVDHKVWGLHKRKDLMQPNPQLSFWRIYQWAAQTLAVNPTPNVYLKRDQSVAIRNGNLNPPAFIVGNTLFQNAQEREVAFGVGKQLSLARPEHYLGSGIFPTENLKFMFMVAMQLTNPSLGMGRGNADFMDFIQKMKKMPPPELMRLRKIMQQYLNAGRNPNLSAWRKGVDHTTNRVGLLVCGDLLQAVLCIKNEQIDVSKLTVKEKIKELVIFSISDEYFQLRKELGLALRSG